jgi:hypothetical protein
MALFKLHSGRYVSLLVLTLCAGALGSSDSSAAQRKDILFESNFETGSIKHVSQNVDGWYVKVINPDHAAITSSASRESDNGIRLFIDKDLDYSSVNQNEQDKPRVNLGKTKLKFDYETDYWAGWSVYIPSSWKDDLAANSTTTMQLKQPIGGSPIMEVTVKGGNWVIFNRQDESAVTWNSDTSVITELYKGPTSGDKGKWVDFVVKFRLCESLGCDGEISIWKDGERIVKKTGPNAYRRSEEKGGPFFGLYLYKGGWKRKESLVQTREIFFDAVRIGGPQSDYESVAPYNSGGNFESEPKPLPPTLGSD